MFLALCPLRVMHAAPSMCGILSIDALAKTYSPDISSSDIACQSGGYEQDYMLCDSDRVSSRIFCLGGGGGGGGGYCVQMCVKHAKFLSPF